MKIKSLLLTVFAFALYLCGFGALIHTINSAEYIFHGTFGSANFPTPAAGSYYNSNLTNYGSFQKWRINDGTDAAFNSFSSTYGDWSTVSFLTNTIDLVAPDHAIAPSGANAATNTLIDLCGLAGPSTIVQSGSTFTIGQTYTLTVVSEAAVNGVAGVVFLKSGSGLLLFPPSYLGSESRVCYWTNVLSGSPGHTDTNGSTRAYVFTTNAWATNSISFTADHANWFLFLAGVGTYDASLQRHSTHRNLLLRSVSITD